jgi:hypothetical protein
MKPGRQDVLDDQPASRAGAGVSDRERDAREDPGREVPFVVGAGRGICALRDDQPRAFATGAGGQQQRAE